VGGVKDMQEGGESRREEERRGEKMVFICVPIDLLFLSANYNPSRHQYKLSKLSSL